MGSVPDVSELREALTGDVLLAADPGYPQASSTFNLNTPLEPAVITVTRRLGVKGR